MVGTLLVVPTAYWIRLRLPRLRPVIEFITLLPLVIPAIVLVFGYLRMYNSSSLAAADGHAISATNILLTFGYVTLALPYMYRAVDAGLAGDRHPYADGGGRKSWGALADHPVPDHPPEHPGRRAQRRAS